MKMPDKIKGRHRLRDAMILQMVDAGFNAREIKEQRNLNLSTRRIDQIIYKNREVLKVDKEWENIKSVNRIKRRIRILEQTPTKKDPLDWEDLLDKKVGDTKVERVSGDTRIIIIRPEAQATTNIGGVSVIRPSVQEAVSGNQDPQVSG